MRPVNQHLRNGIVASCLVLLQLVTALHFALVPHGFSAGLNGFVHVHRALTEPRANTPRVGSQQPSLVAGAASCAPDSCPIGFAGAHSVLFGAAAASGLLPLPVAEQSALPCLIMLARRQVLLSAPKTSPPAQA